MEGIDFQAYPGLFWKQEHLKKKLLKIETELGAVKVPATNVPETSVPPSIAAPEYAPIPLSTPSLMDPEELKRIRASLKTEKQEAVIKLKHKREAYRNGKRFAGEQTEEVAKLHEEFMKAKEEAFQKKRALCEFNAKTRASGEEDP